MNDSVNDPVLGLADCLRNWTSDKVDVVAGSSYVYFYKRKIAKGTGL